MADTVSKERRSEIMSHIKSTNTSIELKVRKYLHALGFRYRVNLKSLPGKPDIVFTKKKIAIFIHGCFWHGHEAGCRYSHTSKTRVEYWSPKLQRTKERDNEHIESLSKMGWTVLVLWECEIKQNFELAMGKILKHIDPSHK